MAYLTFLRQSIREDPGKALLLVLIAATSVAPVLFVRYPEPEPGVVVFKFLAKCGSLAGTMLLGWQLLLGFRGALPWLMTDLIWVIELHKKLGAYGTLLVLLHPIFISLYYVYARGFLPLAWGFAPAYEAYVMLGQVSLGLLLVVALTSVWFRGWMSFTAWRRFHLTSYLILPLAIVHGLALGSTLGETSLRFAWYGLGVLLALFYLYRLLMRAGAFTAEYEVAGVTPVADAAVEIRMKPVGKRIRPLIGQFVYFRRGALGSVHPYTVSRYDADTGLIAITVKALGDTSEKLQHIAAGERVRLDGPYGIFTREARDTGRPLIMIAGGIGVTPFIRLAEKIEKERQRGAFLFYANRFKKDMAYKEELDRLERVMVVHVLSDEPEYEGEIGLVTLELIRKYVLRPLTEHEFLICGPEPMTAGLEKSLLGAGVPAAQIHHELFSY